MNIDLELDFGAFDGLWVLIGLPVLALLVFLVLSPLSFLVYKPITKSSNKDAYADG